ncbi:MAG TPA: dihydrofolate reductase family protein [Thermomicrobiales bacterium]|nr:dihydrofolate reductase family protein [Thermomicrobiales bacterium]
MAQVGTGLSMSLDGFIAGPNDSPSNPLGDGGERLFAWYGSGNVEVTAPSGTMSARVSPESAAHLQEIYPSFGALVTGRRTFDFTDGWGGLHPADVPVFVVTHEVPEEWVRAHPDAPFTFVTDGVESAVEQAKAVAGDGLVGVGAASLAQQCLKAGLLDLVHVDLVPVLLGGGVRLFEHLGATPIDLELVKVVDAPGVTHITYRVVKEESA